MAKRTALLVLWLGVLIGTCWCWNENAMDNARERANLAAENAKLKAQETIQDTKENTYSWTNWAFDKFSE